MVTKSQKSDHGRLWAKDRREQLLAVAAKILAEDGVVGVRIPEVAHQAGVTRPVVYKHFANRQEILVGVVENFQETLHERLTQAMGPNPELMNLQKALKVVVNATCDVLEEQGPGPWYLVNARGTDPVTDRVSERVRREILAPWIPKIGDVTGLKGPALQSLGSMTAACARTNLGMWLNGELSRQQAVKTLIRATTALLAEFGSKP